MFGSPMVLCSPGRRMSASMSSTREPPSASASARLQAVVVFPSSGWLLVTAITRVDSPPLVKTSDVRSERNASPKSCGTVSVRIGTRLPRTAGTSPRSGSFRRRVTSSGVLTESSRYSMPNASPKAMLIPARSAVSQSLFGLGEIGTCGASARSISRTLFARLLATTVRLFCWSSSDL
jgi:hypothetical protein